MTWKELSRVAPRFPELTKLLLNDNRIAKVEARSFVEMTKLSVLSLEGNKVSTKHVEVSRAHSSGLRYVASSPQIKSFPDETFQNLHRLERLDLAFNQVEYLNLAAFDSVGTLEHLHIDLSHNNMQALRVNR